jgi:hypothetical protein
LGSRLVLLGLIGIVGAVNVYLVARSAGLILQGAPAVDWAQYVEAGRRVFSGGDLYAVTDTYAYHYSPVLAWAFAPLAAIGTVGWRLLHFVAVLALPGWPMRMLGLLSWPFWYDVEAGNLLAFVVLAAAWAARGSRVGSAAFLALVLLVPRPLMLPVAAWVLWKQPEWRIPFVAAFAVHAVVVVATGWADDWTVALLAAGGDVTNPSNVGPSRVLGTVPWVLIGVPLAGWLTVRGRLGLASLMASPYWLPYYLLVLLLELRTLRWPTRRAGIPRATAS